MQLSCNWFLPFMTVVIALPLQPNLQIRIFLGLFWRRISAPSQLKNKQKLPKMVYIIPNCLILLFGDDCMKIWTKIAKLQMHENVLKKWEWKHVFIHIFMQIFMSLYEGQWKQQTCYSFTLLISYVVFNPFQMAVQFIWTASNNPNFDCPNAFFHQFNRPLAPTSGR